ncbi:hypothetical protein LY76DRAFT_364629 [Colletotrichum caudatum]|nr:hypothetical protein LY76DRAFT_364629 [Colletotrichum caudatum]
MNPDSASANADHYTTPSPVFDFRVGIQTKPVWEGGYTSFLCFLASRYPIRPSHALPSRTDPGPKPDRASTCPACIVIQHPAGAAQVLRPPAPYHRVLQHIHGDLASRPVSETRSRQAKHDWGAIPLNSVPAAVPSDVRPRLHAWLASLLPSSAPGFGKGSYQTGKHNPK